MMENGNPYDPNWWKKPAAQSLERKKSEANEFALAQPGDSFLIVTEGEVTEPVYFSLLRDSLQLNTVTVKIQPSPGSDPRTVIRSAAEEVSKLKQEAKQNRVPIGEVEKFDHVWAVIDTDVAVREAYWPDVVKLAKDLNVNLAHSTPCIEYWFLLHFKYTTRTDLCDGKTAKKAVEKELGGPYSTNEKIAKTAIPKFLLFWPKAVKRAEQVRSHHHEAGTEPPVNPSTEVDLLVRSLNDSAPLHMRKL